MSQIVYEMGERVRPSEKPEPAWSSKDMTPEQEKIIDEHLHPCLKRWTSGECYPCGDCIACEHKVMAFFILRRNPFEERHIAQEFVVLEEAFDEWEEQTERLNKFWERIDKKRKKHEKKQKKEMRERNPPGGKVLAVLAFVVIAVLFAFIDSL